MPASVLLRGADLTGAEHAVAAAYDALRLADRLFSTYRDDSEVMRLRRGELAVVDANPLVQQVLARCDEARERTDGWFDVDLPGGLDPSGLVKGWAVERSLAVLAELAGVDVCLNVGGDVAVRTEGEPFVVGIEDPHDRTGVVAAVPLAAGGLATSGTSARGEHILDPRSGRPVASVASVSVTGPSLMWADVFATAAFARGGGLDWVAGLPAYEAMVVGLDGTISSTDGWPGTATAAPVKP